MNDILNQFIWNMNLKKPNSIWIMLRLQCKNKKISKDCEMSIEIMSIKNIWQWHDKNDCLNQRPTYLHTGMLFTWKTL